MYLGLTAEALAQSSGHEDCHKAIVEFFLDPSALSSAEHSSPARAATGVSKPGTLCILTRVSANVDCVN